MKKITKLILAALPALLLTACARTIIPEEVLQLPPQGKVYTAYNLYCQNPEKMDCANELKGTIIPFGTEVRILKATDRKITFCTVKDKKEYTVYFDETIRMQSPEEYMKELFSGNSGEILSEGISVMNLEKIRRGVVEKGMTKKEVRLAYGPPCRFKTPGEHLNTWTYWTDFLVGKRMVFNNDRLVEIIVLQ